MHAVRKHTIYRAVGFFFFFSFFFIGTTDCRISINIGSLFDAAVHET